MRIDELIKEIDASNMGLEAKAEVTEILEEWAHEHPSDYSATRIHVNDLCQHELPVVPPDTDESVPAIQVQEEDGSVNWYAKPVESDKPLKIAWVHVPSWARRDLEVDFQKLPGEPPVLLKERLSEERLRNARELGVAVYETRDNGDGTYILMERE